jgi:hypothetical protein
MAFLTVVLVFAALAGPVAAQTSDEADADETAGPVASTETGSEEMATGGGGGVFGRTSERRRLIPGLWGVHFFDRQPLQPFWTRGGGIQYSGWFGGAFLNSYDRLSLIGGLEREWLTLGTSVVDLGVGYRAGLLTGYDRQLFNLADKLPILPFVGLDVWLQTGPIALDVFYVYRALSVEASIAY